MHGQQQPHWGPHPYQQPYPFQQGPPPKKRRIGLIIVAVLAAVLLVAGGVTAAFLIKGETKRVAAEVEAAENGVIAQKIEPGAVRYGDVAIIDACAVMPGTLLEELGFRDAAHGWHSQRYLPESVPVAGATVRGEVDAISTCLYESMAEGGIERFTASVRQWPFNYESPGVGPGHTPMTAAGLKAYLQPGLNADSFNARVISADGRAEVVLGGSRMSNAKGITDPKATFVKLLEGVAANFAKGAQQKATHMHAGRYESVPNACDVLSGKRFEEIANGKDSGVVEADYYERESAEPIGDKFAYSNLQECRRLSPEWFDSGKRRDAKALKISLKTYRDAGMALEDVQDCSPDSPSRKITGEAAMATEKIGDSAACSYLEGDSPTISFLAGRTQVRLTGYGDWAPNDPRAYVKQLTPAAQRLADEVRKAIG